MHPVIFVDTTSHAEFFTMSTLTSEESRDVEGVNYYIIPVEISSSSHPFYTGKQILVDTARRVERFEQRAQKKDMLSVARKGKKIKRAAKATKKSKEEVEVKKEEAQ